MHVKVLGAERRRRWSYDEKVRLVEATALAQPDGRRADSADPGEPVGRHEGQGDQAVRTVASDRRHHGSAQERDIPTDAKLLNRAREKLVRLRNFTG